MIFILVLANLVKMVPSIVTVVFIHRLKSDRWQYIYRVLFVVPMIVPAMVGLAVWKSSTIPCRAFNRILLGTGFLDVLVWVTACWGGTCFTPEPILLAGRRFSGDSLADILGVSVGGHRRSADLPTGLFRALMRACEAVDLDNASTLQKFFHIELPYSHAGAH